MVKMMKRCFSQTRQSGTKTLQEIYSDLSLFGKNTRSGYSVPQPLFLFDSGSMFKNETLIEQALYKRGYPHES
jgi:hypothetical protein